MPGGNCDKSAFVSVAYSVSSASRPPSSPVAAIIPAFDSAATIAAVVTETLRAFAGIGTVYVVDDGSRDGTGEIARAAGAIVVTHDQNRGKGAALRTGFERAYADGHLAAVTLDADGQHPPADAKRLAAVPNLDALVLGIRDLKGAGAPRPNRISNAISNGFLSLFSRKLLADTQCGLRRYPLPRALEIGGRDAGYAFEAEVILRAVAAGLPLVEVPVSVIYPPDRVTHFDSVKDPARIVTRVIKTLVVTRGLSLAPASAEAFAPRATSSRPPRAPDRVEPTDRRATPPGPL